MLICMLVASLITIFNIFSFFGKIVSGLPAYSTPNMFDLMFGAERYYQGYGEIQWKLYPGMLALFIIQIVAIIMAISAIVICYKIKFEYGDEENAINLSIFSCIVSLIATILSFCTLSLTDSKSLFYYGVELGTGPILYSILNIVAIILLIVGLLFHAFMPTIKFKIKTSSYKPTGNSSISTSSVSIPTSSKPSSGGAYRNISEDEKIELIKKYKEMYDNGIITKEEFNKKKSDLL